MNPFSELDRRGVLFFLQRVEAGPVLVGVSTKFPSRLAQLRADNADPLQVLGIVPFLAPRLARMEERAFKRLHVADRLHDDWYAATPKVMADIEERTTPVREELPIVEEPIVEPLLTVEDLCAALKLDPVHIRRFAQRRLIPHVRVGRQFRFTQSQIERWLSTKTPGILARLRSG